MIQELLGGGNVGIIGNGERSKQLSTPPCGGGSIVDGSSSQSPSTAAAAAASTENLRCPRCDSSNTKFCYYNNYNLTQPRHFCKTCRRYWTKGGALRNVPIGGGCRKNKNTTISVGKSCAAGKLKTTEIGKTTTALFSGFEHAPHDHAISSNPILWASSSQNSHFLSLLRSANQTPNPMKEETLLFGSSSPSNFFGFDPTVGPAGLHRNQSQAIIHDEVHQQHNGIQELLNQRLRSTSTSCYPEHISPLNILGNMASANSSTILESAPVASTGELGMFWNSTLSWPTDLPTTSGAYP